MTKQTNTKHILFILDYYLPHQGGAEKLFAKLVEKLLLQGDRVTIITSKHNPSLPSKTQQEKLTILRTGHSRYSLWRAGLRKALQFFVGKYQRQHPVTHIHTTTYTAALPAYCIGKFFNKPVSITIHELFHNLRKSVYPNRFFLYKRYEKLITKLSFNYIIAVSQATKKTIKKYAPKSTTPISVVYNGVDEVFYQNGQHPVQDSQSSEPDATDARSIGSGSALQALYFGHCGFSKGLDTYIEAIPTIYKHFPQTEFVFNLLASKNRGKTIEKLNNLQDTIPITITTGMPKQALIEAIKSSSVVVVPSRSEGFGLAAAETCAIGTPLITTTHGALPEVVGGEIFQLSGYEPGDYLQAREALMAGNFTKLKKKQFSREKTFQAYNTIWENLQ